LIYAAFAGASDATYHIMWIVIFNALDDFGFKESSARVGSPSNGSFNVPGEVEVVKKKVLDEALHGALRIAGLAGRSIFCATFNLNELRDRREF
jgi:hypothetical protein